MARQSLKDRDLYGGRRKEHDENRFDQTICLGNIKGGAHETFTDPLQPETTALILVDIQGRPESCVREPLRATLAKCSLKR